MDPWEIAVIAIGSLVGAVALYTIGTNASSIGQGLAQSGVSVLPKGFFAMINFLPMGLITFGFIADVLQQKFRYSIASIAGLGSILVNKILSSPFEFVSGGQRGGAEGWCTIPGLESLESRQIPMTIVSTFTILFYFLLSAVFVRPASENIAIGSFLGGLGIFQLLIMLWNGCFEQYRPIRGNIFFNIFAGWLLGAGLGAVTFQMVYNKYPFYLPFETMNITTGPGGTVVQSQGGGGICQPVPGSDTEFVCDL